MRISHLGHACLLVEVADERVLIDPGAFTEDLSEARELSAIIVTHQHADHLDPARFPDLVRANPRALVLTDPMSADVVRGWGIEVSVSREPTTVGEVTLTPVGDWHAVIHEEIPRITNVGVRIGAPGEPSLFHPGDALDADPGEVDVLAFPLNAPWQRSAQMCGFLRRLNAPYAVPIHDGLLQARGRNLYLGQADSLGGEQTQIRDLAGAGAVEFR